MDLHLTTIIHTARRWSKLYPYKAIKKKGYVVNWCFVLSQPKFSRITSGLETNINPSPTYPAQKS